MWLSKAAAVLAILTSVVVLAAEKAPKKEKQAQVEPTQQELMEQKKLKQIPVCPEGCVPGRKSGLFEQLSSKCPEGCRPGKVE